MSRYVEGSPDGVLGFVVHERRFWAAVAVEPQPESDASSPAPASSVVTGFADGFESVKRDAGTVTCKYTKGSLRSRNPAVDPDQEAQLVAALAGPPAVRGQTGMAGAGPRWSPPRR